MRRIFISVLLTAALFFAAAGLPSGAGDRAQKSSSASTLGKRQDAAQQPAPPRPAPPQEPAPQRQDQGKITQVVNLVDVLFTVLNRRNKLVPDLEKDDFKVWDDKSPESIRYFSRQTDLPLRIGLLMDTSNSIRDRLKFEQDAATSFLFSVLRRVMILISDGDDNLSNHTRSEAIEMAQRYSVVIYTISTSTQWIQLSQTNPDKAANRKTHLTEGDKILQDLADETGGRAFFPYHVDDLDQSFQDIGDELRNQYSIAYIPTHSQFDGRYHKIRIEVPDHKGYQVRARRGYYAKANSNRSDSSSPSGSAN